MSFVNATLVLSIGDTVEEVTDSGFLGTTPTLSCSSLGDDALVQVSDLYISLISVIELIFIKFELRFIQKAFDIFGLISV